MGERLTKRLRFEILRRDGHRCRYCGATAEETKLAVDHVIPVALGGRSEPSNLVASCAACNAGKSSVAPDAPLVSDVDAHALRWAAAMAEVAERRRADVDATRQVLDAFDVAWDDWRFGDDRQHGFPRPYDWMTSVERFLAAGLDLGDLVRFVDVAMRSQARVDGVWNYFCGCCWREVTARQEAARRMLEGPD
jgi:hypothetical protein